MKKVLKLCVILALGGHAAAQLAPANMSLIPGATYEMGTDPVDFPKLMEKFGIKRAALFEEETPKHRVTIGSFYLDRFEVTNAQFKRFIEQNAAWQKEKIAPGYHNGKYLQDWTGANFPVGKDNYPIVFVSWYAANAYCQAQRKRLPTEAEWEYAARGGLEGKAFPWGDEMPDKTRANYGASGLNAPTAVGSYIANGYGLHDMAGNVWEFLADEWQKYPATRKNDNRTGMQVKTRRALRGGSYGGSPVNLRVTYRDSHAPENAVEHVGFRCALTNPVQSEAVNELLRLHHLARFAHFNRDAKKIYDDFAIDFVNVDKGLVTMPDRDAGMKRMQAYFDASTFLEWDDLTPPIIKVSDDATMAYVVNHKKVRLLTKDKKEEVEVFAWVSIYRKIDGRWRLSMVASTRTPEVDK